VLIAVGVMLVIAFVANRRKFGRYVYSIGGNPDAAELAGINTRWMIVMGLIYTTQTSFYLGALDRISAGTTALLLYLAPAFVGPTRRYSADGRIASRSSPWSWL
jgi:D-xylose transport system permease protein